jgi:hypothetical protein
MHIKSMEKKLKNNKYIYYSLIAIWKLYVDKCGIY